MRIEYHRTLIADTVRNEAFFAALKAAIKPGLSVVADIGAGTGLLGLMASKLGAKEVYLFETAAVAGVAAKILKANKAKNCRLIPCHSTEFQDKMQVDIIVSETLGNYALEENVIETLNDARKRFLKKDGLIIPERIEQFACPVIAPRFHDELTAWDRAAPNLDLGVAKAMSFNNVYVRSFESRDLLDAGKFAKTWDTIDFRQTNRSHRKGDLTWKFNSPETVYGFSYWWRASLIRGISLSTAPADPRTHWEQLYFPLEKPLQFAKGHALEFTISSRSSEAAGTHLAWKIAQKDASGNLISRAAHDLDQGFLP